VIFVVGYRGWKKISKPKAKPKYVDPLYGASAELKRKSVRVSENPDGTTTFRHVLKNGRLVTRPFPGSRRIRDATRQEEKRWEKKFGDKKKNLSPK